MLRQLTSSLAGRAEEGEDSLFGGDAGSGLAKQLFAEQLADTMAKSGGIGLADMIAKKMGRKVPHAGGSKKLANVAEMISDIAERPSAAAKKADIDRPALGKAISNAAEAGKKVAAAVTSAVAEIPAKLESSANVAFQMPVAGRISSKFGVRFHPILKQAKFHGGIDIAVPKGTPVGAAAGGTVKFAGWKGGYGYAVVIGHPDGTETLYGHNERLLVSEGQKVAAGETISLSGSTGRSTGPHVHFEVRENGKLVDPADLLSNVFRGRADR